MKRPVTVSVNEANATIASTASGNAVTWKLPNCSATRVVGARKISGMNIAATAPRVPPIQVAVTMSPPSSTTIWMTNHSRPHGKEIEPHLLGGRREDEKGGRILIEVHFERADVARSQRSPCARNLRVDRGIEDVGAGRRKARRFGVAAQATVIAKELTVENGVARSALVDHVDGEARGVAGGEQRRDTTSTTRAIG